MDREFQRFRNPIEIFIEIFISLLIRTNIRVDTCWLMIANEFELNVNKLLE